jgi:hypothetical protein
MRQMARYGLYRLLGVCVVFLLATATGWSQSITWLGTLAGSSYALRVVSERWLHCGWLLLQRRRVAWDRAAITSISRV